MMDWIIGDMERDEAERRYVGTDLSIGERAIVGEYLGALDAMWRIRVGLVENSWLYLVEKAQSLEYFAHELARLTMYWYHDQAEGFAPNHAERRLAEFGLDAEKMVRYVQARGTHQWSGRRMVELLHPIPPQWAEIEEAADVPLQTAPSITCPLCTMTSYHPMDIRTGYCGKCHEFTSIGTDAIDTRSARLRPRVMPPQGGGGDVSTG